MPVDELWYHADRAARRAEEAYHRLLETHEEFITHEEHRSVSRRRFRTLTDRVERSGAPFGAHTLVYNSDAEILLVRHDGVDLWVLPGGEVHEDETFREAAERELEEEAGIDADYQGLAMLTRVEFSWEDHHAWGVLPIFEATASDPNPSATDPEDEISAADWFDDLPRDTRDRGRIRHWREEQLDGRN